MAGRPSNLDERYDQVMQALVRCVSRLGIEGATLTAIAEEAELTRPLIRHHLGNREEILQSLQHYVLKRFNAQSDGLAAALPDVEPATALIDILFSDAAAVDPDLILAFAALTARSGNDINLREACRASISRFETVVAQAIALEMPQVEPSTADQAAQGIAALYFNVMSLSPLAMSDTWGANAKVNAKQLLVHLKETK